MTTYVLQVYYKYPIYESAEGGYYYDGLEASPECFTFDTEADAITAAIAYADEHNTTYGLTITDAGYMHCDETTGYGFSTNHKHIGEGIEIYVENIEFRGFHAHGYEPYE